MFFPFSRKLPSLPDYKRKEEPVSILIEVVSAQFIVNERILAGLTINTPKQGRKSCGLELSSEKQSLACNVLPARSIRSIAGLVARLYQPQQEVKREVLATSEPQNHLFLPSLFVPVFIQLTFGGNRRKPVSHRQKVP